MNSSIPKTDLLDQICRAQTAPVAIKDLDHRFLHANEAFAASFGVTASELIGKNELELGRPKELVLKVIRTPLKDDSGEVVALMVQLQDETEVRELQRHVAINKNALTERDGDIPMIVSLMSCQNMHALVTQLAEVICERTHPDGVCISNLSETGEFMEFVAVVGLEEFALLGVQRRIDEGLVGSVWRSGKTEFYDDAATEGSLIPVEPGTQKCLIPLIVDQKVVSIVSVTSGPDSEDFSKHIPLLERIAGIASMAVRNRHLLDENARALTRSRAMSQISALMTTMEDTTTACVEVCRMVLSALNADHSSSCLIDEHGILRPHVSWRSVDGQALSTEAMPEELAIQGIPNWCVVNSLPGIIKRMDEDPRETPVVYAARNEMNIGSTVCVPLMQQNKVIGSFLISRDRSRRDFTESDIDVFKTIVNQLSMSIDRLKLEEELQFQAYHDRLTTLPNRHLFETELTRSIENARNSETGLTVLFLDLDGFKEVNDTYGHARGDKLLTLVSMRLSGELKSGDVLARMGGDEFAAILRTQTDSEDTHAVAERLLASLEASFEIDGEQISVGVSIGVSLFPHHGNHMDDLLTNADLAMYQAKRGGKDRICYYDDNLAKETRNRMKMEQDLREAIDSNEFHLLYQPQVRCNDNKVMGVEALIRWKSPTRGIVSPGDFIPLAEELGLISSIGSWVINEAVRQLAEWQSTELRDKRVSINIAAPQFQHENFANEVLSVLDRHKVPATLLELEVTESVLMDNVDVVVAQLNVLREAGVRIAIDDFGTGYSSLSYLQDLPLDVLKIDRSFINRLSSKTVDQSLINSIQLLASGLGLETVAEGVELPEQRDIVTGLGCDAIQGFLYSRPVPATEVSDVIEQILNDIDDCGEQQKVA